MQTKIAVQRNAKHGGHRPKLKMPQSKNNPVCSMLSYTDPIEDFGSKYEDVVEDIY